MRLSIALAVVVVICAPAAIAAGALYPKQDCNRAETQMDLNQCAEANYEAADAALNALYKRLLAQDTDAKAAASLRDAERTWISYRDKECARQVGPREGGGSIWPMDMSTCLEEKTAARIRELKQSLDCPAGPNACPE
jgi:uncharacterized protein YecT (DUF1311 family)